MRRRLSISAALAALLVAAKLSTGIAAPTPQRRACSQIPSCTRHHSSAVQRSAGRDYEKALTEFQAAYQESEEPRFLLDIGRCLHMLTRYSEAVATYEKLHRIEFKDDALRESLRRYEAEARSQLSAVPKLAAPASAARSEGRPLSTSGASADASVGLLTNTIVIGGPIVSNGAVSPQAPADARQLLAASPGPTKGTPVPLFKRPWLWGLLGSAVVVSGSAVAAGVLLRPTTQPGPSPFPWGTEQQALYSRPGGLP